MVNILSHKFSYESHVRSNHSQHCALQPSYYVEDRAKSNVLAGNVPGPICTDLFKSYHLEITISMALRSQAHVNKSYHLEITMSSGFVLTDTCKSDVRHN